MAGLRYYAKQPYITGWRRLVSGLCLVSVSGAFAYYMEELVQKRYSTWKGRTALYGDTTIRNGWLNGHKPDGERLND